MTTAEAVNVLRTIPAGTGTARERAIDYAIAELLATPRKAQPRKTAKPKVDPMIASFLKVKFPTGMTLPGRSLDGARSAYAEEMGREVPIPEGDLAVQLSYGLRDRAASSKSRDAAILYAARV